MEHIQHLIVSLCSWLSTVISYQHNSRRGYYEEEYNLYCSWPRLIALLRPTHGTVNKTGAKGMYLDTGKNSREASSSKVVSSIPSILPSSSLISYFWRHPFFWRQNHQKISCTLHMHHQNISIAPHGTITKAMPAI